MASDDKEFSELTDYDWAQIRAECWSESKTKIEEFLRDSLHCPLVPKGALYIPRTRAFDTIGIAEGRRRHENDRLGKWAETQGAEVLSLERKLEMDERGALGECYTAAATGLVWSGYRNPKAPDVGNIADVRTPFPRERQSLIIYERSLPRPYILTLVYRKWVIVRGWCHGGQEKKLKYWRVERVGGGAYYVPESFLLPMSELLDKLNAI